MRTPRKITVVVDNDSWILPYAQRVVDWCRSIGDDAVLCREHVDIQNGLIALYLGCIKITPAEILARNQNNLVVHASDLPKGRGFSPLTWQILEGKNSIPVCLLHIVAEHADAGPVVYRDTVEFGGHELIAEMHVSLGEKTVELCQRYLSEDSPPEGISQEGEGSWYPRRRPKDSELDPQKTIAEQFNLLRIVDNDKYPAFFTFLGHTYRLKIYKD